MSIAERLLWFIEFAHSPASKLWPLEGAGLHFHQAIVFNLVDNAVRYGHAGGSVMVTLRGDEERITIQVQDDGPGIDAQARERVFERFYRGAGHDEPGSGLGLAIGRGRF